ncbi:MAG: hypothetical protein ACE14P_06265 [Methanotrichaceae archaeon]
MLRQEVYVNVVAIQQICLTFIIKGVLIMKSMRYTALIAMESTMVIPG